MTAHLSLVTAERADDVNGRPLEPACWRNILWAGAPVMAHFVCQHDDHWWQPAPLRSPWMSA